MERHDNIYAVTGSADSRAVVTAPSDKYAARTLRASLKASGMSFFCSLAVGGCGGMLKLAAGDIRLPYFSHQPMAACGLTEATARDGYTHLAIQEALRTWVKQSTDLQCDLEVTTADRKGRSDLVVRNAEDTRRLGLEIQLSPLTHAEMHRRSKIYSDAVHHVQWLYGSQDNQACQGEVEQRGYALQVRIDLRTMVCDLGYFGLHGVPDEGSFQTTWRPLTDWLIQPTGLFSPNIKDVLDQAKVHTKRLREERLAANVAEADTPVVPTYSQLHANLSHHYDRRLFEHNAAVRKRVINAIYRRTKRGQLDEQAAVELFQWLSGRTWSSWWEKLLGNRRKDHDIVVHVLDVYSRSSRKSKASSSNSIGSKGPL